jgi:RimJ/RimL family protein N-acetyltransferase/predicted GNAT family acetyltransferase
VIDRIHEFRAALQSAAAERRVPTAHGTAYFSDSVREVYDLNYLGVEQAADASELAAESESVMEPFFHRRVVVERDGETVADGFGAHGWSAVPHVLMAHAREPDRRVDTSSVREVELEDLIGPRHEVTLAEPWGDDGIAQLLDDAKRIVMRAVPTRFFAAIVDGEIAAYCELRSDGRVAQIEDVNTVTRYRGRGLGRAIVQHAVDEGRRANDVVYLEALADDWPRELYAKLGFDTVGERWLFTRFPAPLTRLRIWTPRLELRLATVAELRELYRVAAAGIHDSAFMPFEHPWTDDLDEEEFVGFHLGKEQLTDPRDWDVVLVAFHEGRPIGVQSIGAEQFAETRTVSTGSWLGREWQGRGLGTEMRAGILTLAFDGLGADAARSGAIQGNPQSLGVSRKLGYAEIGSHRVSPRGEPVEHVDLELRREAFRSPVPVEIVGLRPLAPLFGTA